jgi:DHA2 family multidrug resistance protein
MIIGSRIEPRAMILIGFALQAWAGWELAHLDMNPTVWAVFTPMVVQGFGVGLLWVPITMVTFSTLDPKLVPDASSVYHMIRNFGSAVHISLTVTVSVRMARHSYAELVERVTPLQHEALPSPWSYSVTRAKSTGNDDRLSRCLCVFCGHLACCFTLGCIDPHAKA